MERVVRGHYAVGFRWVGSRGKNGEGSAWLARVGVPRAAIPPCGTLGRRPRKARENPSSAFFPEKFSDRACNLPGQA